MKQNQQFLSALLKTIQTGQVEIRSLLDTSLGSSLRNTLESQLREYDSIETEAYTIALQRGWELPELDPAVKYMSKMMSKAKLARGNADSKIAGMMIQGNTMGVVKSMRSQRSLTVTDPQVMALSQKLLKTEQNNIDAMKRYL